MAATTMFDLAVPGHERDMLEDLHYTTHVEPLTVDVVGLDDARHELDELSLREYDATDHDGEYDDYVPFDEWLTISRDPNVYLPTTRDRLVAAIAAQG